MYTTVYVDVSVPWLLRSDSRLKNSIDDHYLDPNNYDHIPTKDVGLVIQIPCSVHVGLLPTAVVQFGHGIFGSKADLEQSYWLQEEASLYGWILWSMDWRAFDRFDIPLFVKTILYNADLISNVRDSTVQGYVNKLFGKGLIYNIINDYKEELGIDASMDYSTAESTWLPSRFIGDSMGSILGSGFVPLAGYKRAVFLVPGSPFSFIAQRSSLFSLYSALLQFQFYNRRDSRIVLNSWQLLLDASESTGWANTNYYNNIDILAQIGLGHHNHHYHHHSYYYYYIFRRFNCQYHWRAHLCT